jgi:hypothetical protein
MKPVKVVVDVKTQAKVQPVKGINSQFSTNQVALKYFYEGEIITRENAKEIVALYNLNSDETLFLCFNHYSIEANRRGKPKPFTLKRLKNKTMLFESVIALLSYKASLKALDDLEVLKSYFLK